jgi:hypothetical protein
LAGLRLGEAAAMISSLQDLVAPLTEEEFIALLRERKITFRRSPGVHRFQELLDWDTFYALITSGKIPLAELRVFIHTRLVPQIFYTQNERVDQAKLARLIDRGASLIVSHLDPHVPGLETICQAIKLRVGETIWPAAIVSTGTSGALELHFDYQDNIILQIEGTKLWKIYGSPVCHPMFDMPKQTPPSGEPIFIEMLEPGDFLFVPAGYWHYCENGPGRSLHLGILFQPPAGWDVFNKLTKKLLADEIFRVPLTRLSDAEQLSAHEVALKQRLIEKIERLSLAEFLANQRETSSLQ